MKRTMLCMVFLCACLGGGAALAHVPYLEDYEGGDYSADRPFRIGNIKKSIAAYSYLTVENDGTTDVDVYSFAVAVPTRIYVESLVPVCSEYRDFLPWFAIVGPGLPQPAHQVPFAIPAGSGAIVVENYSPGEERPEFFEPFGDKSYYDGPNFDSKLPAGKYKVYFWDPYGMGGDYVAVFGFREIWLPRDIVRAARFTPKIRDGEELHIDCK